MDNAALVPVSPSETVDALRLVFTHLDEPERNEQIDALLAAGVTREGLGAARREGRLVGAAYAQIQPGRAALAWPPGLVSGEPATTAVALLAAMHDRLRACGVAMITMLLEDAHRVNPDVLASAGYAFLTELLYLVASEDVFPTAKPAGPLEFEPYDGANHARLAAMVQATYAQTRDCPNLNDSRSIDDVLLGYRHTGVFDPSRWRIVRHAGQDVGCLLVTDHPAHASCELIYMGLVVAARGHGWGKEIARYAQWLTAQAGRPRLVLAVDSQNGPGLAMYGQADFHAWDRRHVYVKRFEVTS